MTQPTVKLAAYYKSSYDYGTRTHTHCPECPEFATAGIDVDSIEAARELAAQFPKNLRLRAVGVTGPIDGDYRNGSVRTGMVSLHVTLAANGANGGRNETGIKRLFSFLRKAEALGLPVEWNAGCLNSYASFEQFAGAVR